MKKFSNTVSQQIPLKKYFAGIRDALRGITSVSASDHPVRRRNPANSRKPVPVLFIIILLCSAPLLNRPALASPANLLEDETYGFSINTIKGWKGSVEEEAGSSTYSWESRWKDGSMIVIAMDPCGDEISMEDFVTYMEPEIAGEIPIVRKEGRIQVTAPLFKPLYPGLEMRLFEYRGKMEGYKVQAIIGYVLGDAGAYTLIGICGDSDKKKRKQLAEVFQSFKTSPAAGLK
jgi:hypothetical protein